MKKRKTSIIWTIDKDQLQMITKSCDSLAGVLRKLGYTNHLNSALYKPLKKRIEEDDIDISHIKMGRGSNKGRCFTKHTKETFLKRLSKTTPLNASDRKNLIRLNIIPHTNCSICNQDRMWNEKSLTLQVDHIDGDPFNNDPKNLRFICPNCHTQTETFNIGNKKVGNTCVDCSTKITTKSSRCRKCASDAQERPTKFETTKEELEDLIFVQKLPMTKIGQMFGVSDNAIRKRCKSFNIDFKNKSRIGVMVALGESQPNA